MPRGVISLLGLGLKLCIKRPRPTNRIRQTIDRFKGDVRLLDWLLTQPPDTLGYIPGLYIKSGWKPDHSPDKAVEGALFAFEKALIAEQARYNVPTISNLTPRH